MDNSNKKKRDSYIDEVVVLISSGAFGEALKVLHEALKIDPKNVFALARNGYALVKLGKYQEAINFFNEALKIDPKNVHILNDKGFALSKLGKYQEAVESYDETLKNDPYNAYALNKKGYNLIKLGKNKEALAACDEALKIDPQNVYARNDKNHALCMIEKEEKAVNSYNEALKTDLKQVGELSDSGVALSKLGKYQEAIDSYDALKELSEQQKAVENHNKVLKIDLNDDGISHNEDAASFSAMSNSKKLYKQRHRDYIESDLWKNKKKTLEVIYNQNGWPIECVKCETIVNLHFHHNYYIKPEYQGHENVSDIDFLCSGCHDGWHEIQRASALSQNNLFNEYHAFITHGVRDNNKYLDLLSKKVEMDDDEITHYFSREDVKKFSLINNITMWLIVIFFLILSLLGIGIINVFVGIVGIFATIVAFFILDKINVDPGNYDMYKQRKIPIDIKKLFLAN